MSSAGWCSGCEPESINRCRHQLHPTHRCTTSLLLFFFPFSVYFFIFYINLPFYAKICPRQSHTVSLLTSQSPEPAQREISQCRPFAAGEGEFRVLRAGQDAASARGHHQPAGQGLGHPADHQLPAHAHFCQPGRPTLEPLDGGRQQLQQRWEPVKHLDLVESLSLPLLCFSQTDPPNLKIFAVIFIHF